MNKEVLKMSSEFGKNEKQNIHLVSIVIPVYNVELYIKKCIMSVLHQSFVNLEIIIVDDGSTDLSLSICKEIAKKDKRVKVFTKKNGGLSDARNFGISKANGDYVFFLDGDDMIQKNTIEMLYGMMDGGNVIAMCDFESFNKKTHFCKNGNVYTFTPIRYVESVLLLKNNTYACGVLIPRQLLTTSFFIKGRYFEDMASMYKIYSKCDRIKKTDCRLYKYRRNPNSIVHTVNEKKINDRIESANDFAMFCRKKYDIDDKILNIYMCEAFKSCFIMSKDYSFLEKAKYFSVNIPVGELRLKNRIKFSLFKRPKLFGRILIVKQLLSGVKP